MNKGKRKSTTVFSRDEIGVEQLQSLKEKFADGDLNEKEFVGLFREIIDASLSETQLIELFQKIDANSDGTVDWDELTNYMFLSGSDNSSEFVGDDGSAFYETYQPDKLGELTMEGPGGSASASGASTGSSSSASGGESSGGIMMRPTYLHKDLITRVIRLDKPYLYLTASKDGSVRTWNAHSMQFQNVLTTGRNWLTDCCVMRRSNRLAVTSMNRTLGIYDLGSNTLIGEINEYSKRQAIPLCVEYVEKPADDREALVIGDDTGGITVMTCSDQWLSCDGRSTTSTAAVSGSSSGASGGGGGSSSVSTSSASSSVVSPSTSSSSSSSSSSSAPQTNAAGSASLEAFGFSSRTKFKKHTDWVTRVKWVNDMRAIVATSLDTNISIIDIDRMVVKFEYQRHKKGVFDLVWCASTRLIASCGLERDISIWNPYSSQRAVATLRGHTSSVLHLASDDDNYQIISVASDNTFKVWDVRNHRCLQTWVDHFKSTGGAENRISALLFDSKQPGLVSATTHLTRWPFKVPQTGDDENGNDSSEAVEKPMCLASYNSVFHQVVTAEMSAESVVKTWSAETGDEICSFANAHGTNPITAISFDYPGRRLLTGSHDGALIKMWNFSNGALVKQFHKAEDTASSSSSSSASTQSSAATATSSSTLADDLAFLGIDSNDGEDDDATTKGSNGTPSAASSAISAATSPRKRKRVRDIMLLPPTFGVDLEGRKNASALSEYTELPSPTRTRLHPSGDREVVKPKASSHTDPPSPKTTPPDPVQPTPPPTDAPASTGRTPRARRSSVSGSSSSGGGGDPAADAAALLEAVSSARADKGAKYTEKEVTCILDIERNLRVGMGDYICQRFVCCVGWDRRLFIWADKNDESEALPVHILPQPDTPAHKCHALDILALVYIPPAYIATAGLDGAILLWSLNSGDFLARVYQSAGSIDAMHYAPRIEMLFASGERGQLVCVDRSMSPRAVLALEHPSDEAVTALRCDRTNTHLVTGDAAGYVKVWDLTISPDHEGLMLDVVGVWRAPGAAARVSGLDFVENVRATEPFLLLSSGNGDVSLWTLDGVQIGSFGKHRSWQLGRPLTYMASHSSCLWPPSGGGGYHSVGAEGVPSAVLASTMTKRQFIHCFSIAALSGNETARDTFLLEDSMPKPGEVWVCASGHRSTRAGGAAAKKAADQTGGGGATVPSTPAPPPSSSERRTSNSTTAADSTAANPAAAMGLLPAMFRRSSNNSGSSFMQVLGAVVMRETLASPAFLQQRLSAIAGEITEIITVVKVTRGEISCWDGNGHKPPLLKVIEMSDFVRKAGWVKQPLLTQYIGRMFAEDQTHYHVSGISLVPADPNKPDRKTFSVIDTNGQEHSPKPLNEALSIARVKAQAQQAQQHASQSSTGARNRLSSVGLGGRKRTTATPPLSSASRSDSSGKNPSVDPSPASPQVDSESAAASAASTIPSSFTTLTTSVTTENTLPLIKTKDKRAMGGLLPKRSTVRMRHDQSVDFRRIHAPEEIPKSFRAALQQRLQGAAASEGGAGGGSSNNNSSNASGGTTTRSSSTARSSVRFDGVLPS